MPCCALEKGRAGGRSAVDRNGGRAGCNAAHPSRLRLRVTRSNESLSTPIVARVCVSLCNSVWAKYPRAAIRRGAIPVLGRWHRDRRADRGAAAVPLSRPQRRLTWAPAHYHEYFPKPFWVCPLPCGPCRGLETCA